MIKVMVMSKLLAEHIFVFDDDTLVISITSPGSEQAEIKGDHIYKFQFHDVREDLMLDSGIMNAMTDEMAEAIVEVMVNNRHLKKWVIHCEAGVSRSPAIAIGAARYLDVTPGMVKLIEMFPCYNTHVVKSIHKALRKKLNEIEAEIDRQCGCYGEDW